jgi:tRNA (guanine37-N1)-methyltransferase
MLDIYIISVHPKFIESYKQFGVMRFAEDKNLAKVHIVNLRDFAVDKYGSVDDRPYGGGDGMIMRPEPLAQAVEFVRQKHNTQPFVVLTTPGAPAWQAMKARHLSKFPRPVVIICGRFAGVDQRFIDKYVNAEFSVGDFVVSGGELPALMIADSMIREIPGSMGHEQSAYYDSFAEGFNGGLEHPLYTRPHDFLGQKVPEVLMSGDHKKIEQWRSAQALRRTIERRPDLVSKDKTH